MDHIDNILPMDRDSGITDVQGGLRAPELTVVVPTFNERENVAILVERLRTTLVGCNWEVIFVDDNSPDGTAAEVRNIGKMDRRVRCIRRIGRRGLSGACLEGVLASQAVFVAVMDGDLQHDESCLTAMLGKLRGGEFDLVVASRYVEGGSASIFSTWRSRFSHWATGMARYFVGVNLTDPMSGFFMLRRSLVEDIVPALSTQGFKILLDIVATVRGKLRVAEIPYSFRVRQYGESKLDARVALDFISLTIGKLTADVISSRFLMFCSVGLVGLALHMLLLRIGMLAGVRFVVAQTLSTVVVISVNFAMNNALTYRDQRLTGKRFVNGLIRFEIICSVGIISNVGVASWIYAGNNGGWWLAGLGGAVMGGVWNYVLSVALVWQNPRL